MDSHLGIPHCTFVPYIFSTQVIAFTRKSTITLVLMFYLAFQE